MFVILIWRRLSLIKDIGLINCQLKISKPLINSHFALTLTLIKHIEAFLNKYLNLILSTGTVNVYLCALDLPGRGVLPYMVIRVCHCRPPTLGSDGVGGKGCFFCN